jgi:SAM-dependent methyltransferase
MSLTRFCLRIYQRVAAVLLPGVRYHQYDYEDSLRELVIPGLKWLDLGCGRTLLPEWRRQQEKELTSIPKLLVGIDEDRASLGDHSAIRALVDGRISALPFDDGAFDLATSNMVVEHLRDPEQVFVEVNRILRPGGQFLFITPNLLGYKTLIASVLPRSIKNKLIFLIEGRREEDVFPTFYRANTERSIHAIARRSGFDVAEIRMVQGGAIPTLVLFPPLLLLEVLLIRVLLTRPFRRFRAVIVAKLVKRSTGRSS